MPSQKKEHISRTQKKKAALALQRTGERLVTLGAGQLAELALPEALREAVLMAKQTKKHEARRRQMQYIGSLMRQYDGAAIEKALDEMSRQDDDEVRRFKQIEQWRDELVGESGAERVNWLLERFPQASRQRLVTLVQAARGAAGNQVDKKAGRKLFRYLRALSEDDTAFMSTASLD